MLETSRQPSPATHEFPWLQVVLRDEEVSDKDKEKDKDDKEEKDEAVVVTWHGTRKWVRVFLLSKRPVVGSCWRLGRGTGPPGWPGWWGPHQPGLEGGHTVVAHVIVDFHIHQARWKLSRFCDPTDPCWKNKDEKKEGDEEEKTKDEAPLTLNLKGRAAPCSRQGPMPSINVHSGHLKAGFLSHLAADLR